MESKVLLLELVWRTRPGGGGKTERTYLDFVVDGVSLGDLLDVGDRISCLGWESPERDEATVQVLRLLASSPAPLAAGRVPLYVCAECGDLDRGAVTARVEKTSDFFIWRDFGFETDYEPLLQGRDEYREIGPFRFEKTPYWQALTQRPPRP